MKFRDYVKYEKPIGTIKLDIMVDENSVEDIKKYYKHIDEKLAERERIIDGIKRNESSSNM